MGHVSARTVQPLTRRLLSRVYIARRELLSKSKQGQAVALLEYTVVSLYNGRHFVVHS